MYKMTKYLEETDIINYSNVEIQKLVISLTNVYKADIEISKNCLMCVRIKGTR